ncbi:MAG: DegT/DnrJ/EryC1/StrS family aminotransferase [Candidatus Colwellbacteria bacterium]|nr:DegT/DnrJ/EryC1/StrS family aminotransferase [Candidatus Colwellbacteria bacterium]
MADVVLLIELKQVPLSKQDITSEEVEAIKEVLSSPYLTIGPKIKEFESVFADYIGMKHAIAVNSGTSGLHLAMRAFEIKDGNEVITTPFSFIASANAPLFERAKPVFVDIDEKTLCIDPAKIEEKITPRTKAILPVDIFGYVADMDPILDIAKRHNLIVIEDACEALGSEYKGKKAGSFGNIAAFGFTPNKQITTAEGGIIVTNNDEVAELCRSMRNQGREEKPGSLAYTTLGYNYRMTELSAALGVTQMKRIEEILARRSQIASLYNERLKKIKNVHIPYVGPEINKMSWFVYVIQLNPEKFSRQERNEVIAKLGKRGVNCRDRFPPIHLEPLYVGTFGYKAGDFPITERVSGATIALPFHNNLTEEEVIYVCDSLEKVLSEINPDPRKGSGFRP